MTPIGLTRPTSGEGVSDEPTLKISMEAKRSIVANKPCMDIKGKRFGKGIAIKPIGNVDGHGVIWQCLCDCGEKYYAQRSALRYGRQLSCGCVRSENSRKLMKALVAEQRKVK